MFADIVGYTSIMQEDELAAKELRDAHRHDLHKLLESHNGKVVQYYGDGTLSIFGSSIDAVNCGVEIQRKSQKDPVVPLRLGIHAGDIIVDNEGAYGDGVNVASRIESMGKAGAVLISDKVYDDIKNQPTLKCRSLGQHSFKNVKRPIEVFAMAADGIVIPSRGELSGKVEEKVRSLAVLPFVNLSADKENEYFSDGITEELINALSKIDGLQVTSRISSFALKGKNPDLKEIRELLDVNSVLQGSVRKAGDKVRISAELVSTLDGLSTWSARYDRELKDIFEVQDEISTSIATQLRKRLSSEEQKKNVVKASTDNVNAYSNYLMGKFHYNKWSVSHVLEAVSFFEKAIDEEPDFAPAYSGLASCYTYFGNSGHLAPMEAADKAEKFASKGLSLDPNLAEAHLALSVVNFFFRWNWGNGRKEAEAALDLNPGLTDGYILMAVRHLVTSEVELAMLELEKAYRIDPLSTGVLRTLGDNHYLSGDYEQAIEYYDKALGIDPDFRPGKEFKGWALLMMGEIDAAIKIFKTLGGGVTFSVKPYTQLGYAYALKGELVEAHKYLKELKGMAKKDNISTYNFDFAILYTALGKSDKAFDYLEKSYKERFGSMILMNLSPIWKPLHGDDRFHSLIQRIGLTFRK